MNGFLEPATPQQRRKITQLNMALKNREHTEEYPMTKGEAGTLIRQMIEQLRAKERERLLKR